MTQTVSIKDLRDNLSEIIEETAIGGKEFVVTKFDKPKAVIVPLGKAGLLKKGTVDFGKLPGFGIWKNREEFRDSIGWVRVLRERQSKRES